MGRRVNISTQIPPAPTAADRLGLTKSRRSQLDEALQRTVTQRSLSRARDSKRQTASTVGTLIDPVADFITRIQKASRAKRLTLEAPASRLKVEVARILKEEGYIANYKAADEEGRKVLRVYLKNGSNNGAVVRDLKRISKPGCRVYLDKDEIRRVQGGLGISIMTTPKGVMTIQQAEREGVGGTVLCEFW